MCLREREKDRGSKRVVEIERDGVTKRTKTVIVTAHGNCGEEAAVKIYSRTHFK